ncbi:transmembrane protein 41B [Gigaspora margarita]|uniref:Transmembrane protein 41B n=1 Tax=Gigaspora margarita TaxID=4874 RepID=A0A8H4AY93_GIGMA|nr:transmembrane protein 41B [Gigaspora margarita]
MYKSNQSIVFSIIILIIIFIISLSLWIFTLNTYLPKAGNSALKFPRTLHDVKLIHEALTDNDAVGIHVMICYIVTYIFLQSFAIPGSVMLSVLGGALWGTWKALLFICFCSATGATICNLLSYYLGRAVTEKFLSKRMEIWNEQLNDHRKHLFSYIIFLRVTPFLPNWFINIASPHLGVGTIVFYFATLLGVAPLSFIHTQAGETIHNLTETDEISFFTTKNIIAMTLIAIAALIPILVRKVFEKKGNKGKEMVIDAKKIV